jgi:predicted PurR-regulated permease PerM
LSIGRFAGYLIMVMIALAVAMAIWQLSDILILLFGAIVLSTGLCAAARSVETRTGMRGPLAMVCVIAIGLTVMGIALWIFGSVISDQIDKVLLVAPNGIAAVQKWLSENPYGRQILDQARSTNFMGATGSATSYVTAGLGVLTRGFGYVVISLFVAIYLAAQPERYRQFCLRLVPPTHQATALFLFDSIGKILALWLAGQIVVMGVVGVMSGIGLYFIGIEAAFTLGLLSGILCFIPFVGAMLAVIPAALIAATQGPQQVGAVILMYIFVHFIEGNFITPMVQSEATDLPPVLAILSTVVFSLLFGAAGILLAAPMTLLLMVTVEILYVQKGLGTPAEII